MSSSSYLETTKDVYREAAENCKDNLCCVTVPIWKLPELKTPKIMQEMNYGCGNTMNPRDLMNSPKIMYVGVGGGMELLQFAYFSRQKGGVIGVDVVDEMLEVCKKNLVLAEEVNPWFKSDFVDLRKGDALKLPLEDETVNVAAQNCLFNIFKLNELKKALAEAFRVLKPRGRLVMSDPVCEQPIPQHLQDDERMRAMCLSGALPLQEYIDIITGVGFGMVEVRGRRPYRVLDPKKYGIDEMILVESVEVCAVKTKMPPDGPLIFTGKMATYYGADEYFDDGKGHNFRHGIPMSVCDKTAKQLTALGRNDIHVSKSTYFYEGGGCC